MNEHIVETESETRYCSDIHTQKHKSTSFPPSVS